MLGLIVILLIVWLAFIVIGAVVHALFWLLVIGVILFLVTSVFGWMRRSSGSGTHR